MRPGCIAALHGHRIAVARASEGDLMTVRSLSRRQLLGRGSLLLSGLAILSACGAPPAAAPTARPAEPAKPAEAARPAAPAGGAGATLTVWVNNDSWVNMGPYGAAQTAQKFPGGGLTINPVQIP